MTNETYYEILAKASGGKLTAEEVENLEKGIKDHEATRTFTNQYGTTITRGYREAPHDINRTKVIPSILNEGNTSTMREK